MKDFYLTLLSDSCLDTFPKNKQSSFTVRLDHPIQIDKENWEVALAEIITPARTKVRFTGEYKDHMQLIFPQPLAEILGVNKTFIGKPIGNEKHQFKYGVDLNTHSNRF